MKFTSKYSGYNLAVAEPDIEYFRDGRRRQIRPAIFVDFGEQSLGPKATRASTATPVLCK